MGVGFTVDELKVFELCTKLVKRVYSAKCGWAFREPVDEVKHQAPNYYTIIKKPVDLKKILGNLQHLQYGSPKEVDADMQLMVANCLEYNRNEEHWIRKAAKDVEKLWSELMDNNQVLKKWAQAQEHRYRQALPDSQLYGEDEVAGPLPQEILDGIVDELLQAADWLSKLFITNNGKRAQLLGGHHSRPPAIWTICLCSQCKQSRVSLNTREGDYSSGGGLLTLEELYEHCIGDTAAGSSTPAWKLLDSFMVEGQEGEGQTLRQFLKAKGEAAGGQALVGQKVWVYWCGFELPMGDCGAWQQATICAYDPTTGEHVVEYEPSKGEPRLPCLRVHLRITFHHAGQEIPTRGMLNPTLLVR